MISFLCTTSWPLGLIAIAFGAASVICTVLAARVPFPSAKFDGGAGPIAAWNRVAKLNTRAAMFVTLSLLVQTCGMFLTVLPACR